jgi:hypothetical protein
VTAKALFDAETGEGGLSDEHIRYEMRSGAQQTIAAPESLDPDLMNCAPDLKGGLSPDGRFGLLFCRPRPHQWPDWWADYNVYPGLADELKRRLYGYLGQWVLLDFEKRRMVRLLSAPYLVDSVDSAPPVWIDGGRQIILPAAFEPLVGVTAAEREARANRYAVLLVGGGVACITPRHLIEAGAIR